MFKPRFKCTFCIQQIDNVYIVKPKLPNDEKSSIKVLKIDIKKITTTKTKIKKIF